MNTKEWDSDIERGIEKDRISVGVTRISDRNLSREGWSKFGHIRGRQRWIKKEYNRIRRRG